MSKFNTAAALDMIYISCCGLNGEKPAPEKLAGIDLRGLYSISKFHSLTALVCDTLEQSGYVPSENDKGIMRMFNAAKEKSVRKSLLLDSERAALFSFMNHKGIWYMPLKGVVLKHMYPKMGLRQMADNDILFDINYRQEVRDWFIAQGYDVKVYDKGNHDVYLKDPVYNYEMHVALFGELHNTAWVEYFKDVKERLVRMGQESSSYRFTDEDFYIYFMAHGYKHYEAGGMGLRFLLDLYVYLRQKGEAMDFSYIDNELRILGLSEFEKDCNELVNFMFGDVHHFGMEALPSKYRDMLSDILQCGTYGTIAGRVDKGVRKMGKGRYLVSRIFPGQQIMKNYHPIFGRYKILLPVGWVCRGVRQLHRNTKSVIREIITAIKW